MRVLIIGCGYLGTPLARRLVESGHQVWGMRRSADGAEELRAAGIQPVIANVVDPATLPAIEKEGWDWVVNAVSSKGGGPEAYQQVYLQGTRNLIRWLSNRPPRRYLHVSSSSVYGQTDGSEVTELSPADPANGTSRVLVETERLLVEENPDRQFQSMILRAAGIYGPGRGHLFHQFLQGEARLTGDGSRWLNMVHLDDLVEMCVALLDRGRSGERYNGADNEPVTERDFFQWLADTLHRPLPPSIPEDQKSRKRGATNKRISNRKIREEVGVALRYPSYREGYGAEIARLGCH